MDEFVNLCEYLSNRLSIVMRFVSLHKYTCINNYYWTPGHL